MASVNFEEQIEVPFDVGTFDAFRQWSHLDAFPERGRVDFVHGCVEVDMSPEDLYCHGLVKTEIAVVLGSRIRSQRLGQLYIDRARVASPAASLSVEPDLVFVRGASLTSGSVRLVPNAGAEPDRYIELEGGPDLVVEVLSDSSVKKDTQRLPSAYYEAGVLEYWIVDARLPKIVFDVFHRGDSEFKRLAPDSNGFVRSDVMNCAYRLIRDRDADGQLRYTLEEME